MSLILFEVYITYVARVDPSLSTYYSTYLNIRSIIMNKSPSCQLTLKNIFKRFISDLFQYTQTKLRGTSSIISNKDIKIKTLKNDISNYLDVHEEDIEIILADSCIMIFVKRDSSPRKQLWVDIENKQPIIKGGKIEDIFPYDTRQLLCKLF